MVSVSIKLDMAESVKKFVNVTSKFDYDMTLKSGRYVVDPKSILGIFSLDLGEPITLEIMDESCSDLLEALKPFFI